MAVRSEPKQDRLVALHQRAKRAATRLSGLPELPAGDIQSLLHELDTYQVELAAQNEELKHSHNELTDSRNRYADLYDSAPMGFVTTDRKGVIREANLRLASMLNVDRGRVLGELLANLVAPASQDLLHLHLRKVWRTSERVTTELEMVPANTGPLWISIESIRATAGTAPRPEIRSAISDITGRKKAEQEKEEAVRQLQQAQRTESLGQLAGGVAHDINNMLTAVTGTISMLQEELAAGDPHHADLQRVLDACHRGHQLTHNLLGFARQGKYVPESLSLNGLVDSTAELLRSTLSKGITVQLSLATDLASIRGDAGQLSHALLNLCLNAADAMGELGALTLTTDNLTLESAEQTLALALAPGPYARLKVVDTGRGMSKETLQRACEPFFTTKDRGRGTGLGLSMAFGTFANHGGTLLLDSTPGRGTAATVLLPAGSPAVATAEVPSRPLKKLAAKGTVLLVDDEGIVRDVGSKLLKRLGFEVVVAEDGKDAVDCYQQAHGQIEFVILDLAMPVMDGATAYRKLREFDPTARVLISSGYFKDDRVAALLRSGAVGFIQKPYTMSSLAADLANALGRSTGPTRTPNNKRE